ncbi:hypothetical protein ACVGXP_01330, partial [Enterobacter hormaechei]
DWFTWYSLRPGKPVVFISARSGFVYLTPGLILVPKKRVLAALNNLFNSWNVSLLLSCIILL